jgi:hypothetical protein
MRMEVSRAGTPAAERKTIGLVVCPPNPRQPLDLRLFEWLSAAFPVRFETKSADDLQSLDGVVYLGKRPRGNDGVSALPSLTYFGGQNDESATTGTIVFGQDAAVHRVLRARSVEQRLSCRPEPLELDGSEVVLATSSGRPFWTMRQTAAGRMDVTAVRVPVVDDKSSFFEYFNGNDFVNLLPLVDLVRRVTGEDQWIQPPLRASFMFDDPNLHSTSYGFINFPVLAQHAAKWNYHVSFATIPLDRWFSSRRAAQLFVEQKSRISFLVHGNDHVKKELAAFASDEQAILSLAQALRRIARLEETTKVPVSRVMAAPFGACVEGTISVMARLGFEAACISSGSLLDYNAKCKWSASLGLRMAEIIEGLPVFPRFRLNLQAKNVILLAAYLGQPLVPLGHHQDVADGLDLMGELAQFINSLGQVRWGDMTSIARSNFLVRHEGDVLRVRPYSRRFQVAVPAGMSGISVEPSAGAFLGENVKITASAQPKPIYLGPPGSTVPVKAGDVLEINMERKDAVDFASVPDRGLKSWALTRRLLTEGRDRLQPWFRWLGLWRPG